MRSYRSLRAQVPYTRAMLGAAEANRRRGMPGKAEDLFTEAEALALEVTQPALEGQAALGLGRIARARGHAEQAGARLLHAEQRFAAHDQLAYAADVTIERARLALTAGRLDEANRLVAEALRQSRDATASTGERGSEALAHALWAAVAMTMGQLDQARAHAHEASELATSEADEEALVEATLVAAEVELQTENLQTAVSAFNRAQAVAQSREATLADAVASVGLGRILLRRELWEEAAEAFQVALPRLRVAEDVAAQALTQVSLGEARRNLEDGAGARAAFAEAARLARASGDPLLEAAALEGEARALLTGPELEAAVGRYRQSLRLVQRVGASIADVGDRAAFFDGYASLYSEAIYAAASERAATDVSELAAEFAASATRPGRSAAAQRLREYAQTIPTSGYNLEPDERERNAQITSLLSAARKTLVRQTHAS
jgi:tetratricopeptide (TPR) repeat protein